MDATWSTSLKNCIVHSVLCYGLETLGVDIRRNLNHGYQWSLKGLLWWNFFKKIICNMKKLVSSRKGNEGKCVPALWQTITITVLGQASGSEGVCLGCTRPGQTHLDSLPFGQTPHGETPSRQTTPCPSACLDTHSPCPSARWDTPPPHPGEQNNRQV